MMLKDVLIKSRKSIFKALKKIAKSKLTITNKLDNNNSKKSVKQQQQQKAQPQQQLANLSLQTTMSQDLDGLSLPSLDVKSIDTFFTYLGEECYCCCCCSYCDETDENQLNENLENEMMR